MGVKEGIQHGLLFTDETKDAIAATSIVISAPKNISIDLINNISVCDTNNIDLVIQGKINKIENKIDPKPDIIIVVGLTLTEFTQKILNTYRDKYGCILLHFTNKVSNWGYTDWRHRAPYNSLTKVVYEYYKELTCSNNYANKYSIVSDTLENRYSSEMREEICFKPYETIKKLCKEYKENTSYLAFKWPD